MGRWRWRCNRVPRVGLDELDAIPEREVLERYPYASLRTQSCTRHSTTSRKLGGISSAHSNVATQQALLRPKHVALER